MSASSVVREARKRCRESEGGLNARACVREWTTTLPCGVMLAASFDLVHEGEPYGPGYVILGVCVGAMFIAFMQRLLHDCEDVKFAALEGADARKTLLMVGIMTAHSLGEGSGVGVSFSGTKGWAQGQLVTLAIGVHNIPEGMAAGVSTHCLYFHTRTTSKAPLPAPSLVQFIAHHH